MKKIVALVLSLALVLALGTVAFAANDTAVAYRGFKQGVNDLTPETTASDVILHVPTETKANDGKTVIGGTTAYYTIGEGTDKYVKVATLADATVVVFKSVKDNKGENALVYLKKVDNVNYLIATAFTNVGEKCGQYNLGDAKKTYYKASNLAGDANYFVADKDGEFILKVGAENVTAKYLAGFDGDAMLVKHIQEPVIDETKGVVGYKCSVCGVAAVKAANRLSIPANTISFEGADGKLYYFPASAAAATTGVTSAKTFDAGVAMYAGLALMSVAGSAVVIGKKKEF